MLPFNDRSRHVFDLPTEDQDESAPFTEPLSLEDDPTAPQPVVRRLSDYQRDASIMPGGQLTLFLPPQPPAVPDALSNVPGQRAEASQKRSPMVIKGSMRKIAPLPPPRAPHKKHRLLVSLVGLSMLLVVVILSFFSASPLGQELGLRFDPLRIGSHLIRNTDSGSNSLIVQATATAIYHRHTDGYDPSSENGQFISGGLGSLSWPLGQCTYWANYKYHLLTGYWIAWSGNANQWVAGAQRAGWQVSTQPHVPSVIVLMPGVQGASSYGHVAVVESIAPGSNPPVVHTSNMNWYTNGGGWNKVSNADFTVGSGVYFVWHA